HVVDFDVAGFVVHDKASGKILRQLSTREFWQRVEPTGKLVPKKDANDARMLYDPLSERWFACAAGTTEPGCFLAGGPHQFVSTRDVVPWLLKPPQEPRWICIARFLRRKRDAAILEDPNALGTVIEAVFSGFKPIWEKTELMAHAN